MNELLKRILFAVPAGALFIFITWVGGWYFKTLIILIGFFILKEMVRLLNNAGLTTETYFPYSIGLWVMVSHYIPLAFEIGMVIFLLFIAIQIFNSSEESITTLTSTVFTGLYAPAGLLCLMLIRDLGTSQTGFLLTVATMLMVWGGDVFAYFGGKTFGNRKLAPDISPNKTWAGFFSGYLGCFAGLTVAFWLIPFEASISLISVLPLIILVGTFGPIGDLLESKIKRKAGVKDSSSLLPGHGGFFDRFDALLLAAPAVWVYLKMIQEYGYVAF